MHIPKHFLEARPAVLIEAITAYPFAMVVCGEGHVVPELSMLPLLYEPPTPAATGLGSLLGHAARNNPLMQDIADGKTVLCVFQGPHTYISPRTYVASRNVPTWNHLEVYCTCTGALLPERENLAALQALVHAMEGGAWTMDDTDPDYIEGLTKGIHAFRLQITDWRGHFKFSQNKADAADVLGAATALEESANDPLAAPTAAWMRRYLAERS
jgi:transcriptional regulator